MMPFLHANSRMQINFAISWIYAQMKKGDDISDDDCKPPPTCLKATGLWVN
jgi:hypothetical protein